VQLLKYDYNTRKSQLSSCFILVELSKQLQLNCNKQSKLERLMIGLMSCHYWPGFKC